MRYELSKAMSINPVFWIYAAMGLVSLVRHFCLIKDYKIKDQRFNNVLLIFSVLILGFHVFYWGFRPKALPFFIDKNWMYHLWSGKLSYNALSIFWVLSFLFFVNAIDVSKKSFKEAMITSFLLASAAAVIFANTVFSRFFYAELCVFASMVMVISDKNISKKNAMIYSGMHVLVGVLFLFGLIAVMHSDFSVLEIDFHPAVWLIVIGLLIVLGSPPFSFLVLDFYGNVSTDKIPLLSTIGSKLLIWIFFPLLFYADSGYLFILSLIMIIMGGIRLMFDKSLVKSLLSLMIMNGGLLLLVTSLNHRLIALTISFYIAAFILSYYFIFYLLGVLDKLHSVKDDLSQLYLFRFIKSKTLKISLLFALLLILQFPFTLTYVSEHVLLSWLHKNSFFNYITMFAQFSVSVLGWKLALAYNGHFVQKRKFTIGSVSKSSKIVLLLLIIGILDFTVSVLYFKDYFNINPKIILFFDKSLIIEHIMMLVIVGWFMVLFVSKINSGIAFKYNFVTLFISSFASLFQVVIKYIVFIYQSLFVVYNDILRRVIKWAKVILRRNSIGVFSSLYSSDVVICIAVIFIVIALLFCV